MSQSTLTFYFDYISPNAYLAWTQLPALLEKHAIEAKLVPVLFAGLLKEFGQIGPAEHPAKRSWMAKNIARKSALLDVPLNPPKHHPFNPLLALRLSSIEMGTEQQWRLVDAFMQGIWVDGLHPSDESDARKMVNNAGLSADELIELANNETARNALQDQTSEAITNGVFGIPSVLCRDELFFGYDDFVYLELMLDGKDPLVDSRQTRDWANAQLKPSAIRKEAPRK